MDFDLSQIDLEQVRQYIELALAEWNKLVEGVPTDELPRRVYVIGTAIALFLWLFVARVLPSPVGRVSWIALFALLCSPTVNSAGDMPQLVPASVAFVYGVLTKNTHVLLTNGTIILSVLAMGLFIAFLWERIKAAYIDILIDKQNDRIKQHQEQLALSGVTSQTTTEILSEEISEDITGSATTVDNAPILNKQVSDLEANASAQLSTEDLLSSGDISGVEVKDDASRKSDKLSFLKKFKK